MLRNGFPMPRLVELFFTTDAAGRITGATTGNGSFVAYQGYLDYMFGAKDSSSDGTGFFNGIYWHSDRYAVGYGLKYFNDIYGLQNGVYDLKTTGFGHYFDVTYKF